MNKYLETIYFRDEQKENDYPQKLCDYLIKNFIGWTIGKSLLDVGSGKGNHLKAFSRRGLETKGVDFKPECLSNNIYECNLEMEQLPFGDNTFDIVFSKSVLEHVVNANNFLSESLRVLKRGGIAILMTPDWNTQHEMFWDDYTHVKAWTRKSLQNAMRINGFDEVESILFRQLPILWKYPCLKILCYLTSLLPRSLKWKGKEEKFDNKWIRFSKEKMILAIGKKK